MAKRTTSLRSKFRTKKFKTMLAARKRQALLDLPLELAEARRLRDHLAREAVARRCGAALRLVVQLDESTGRLFDTYMRYRLPPKLRAEVAGFDPAPTVNAFLHECLVNMTGFAPSGDTGTKFIP
jgi:hypothetical protein